MQFVYSKHRWQGRNCIWCWVSRYGSLRRRSTPSLLSPFCPRVVIPVRVPSMDQIGPFVSMKSLPMCDNSIRDLAQLAGAVEYTDCISAEVIPLQRCSLCILQSDGEAPVMQELWGMHNTPLVISLPHLLCPGVVAPDMVLSMSQIELNWIVWNKTDYMYKNGFVIK